MRNTLSAEINLLEVLSMCQVLKMELQVLCGKILMNKFINVFLTSSWNSWIISPSFIDANTSEMANVVWSIKNVTGKLIAPTV